MLPTEGRDLILAAALLSITINPLVFTIADRLSAWLRTRPDLLVWLERRSDEPLSSLPEETGGHVVQHCPLVTRRPGKLAALGAVTH